MQTTADVFQGCKSQDRKSQKQLYCDFYPDMKRLLYRYLANSDDMDDVINRSMLKVFTSIATFQGTHQNLGGWARSILIHEVLNFLRNNKTFQNRHETWEELPDTEWSHDSGAEDTEHFLQLLQGLPATTRTVFNLYAIEGYSHKEIAEMTGITVANSKWHVHGARKTMQQLFAEKRVV